jgi:hypothetical protein
MWRHRLTVSVAFILLPETENGGDVPAVQILLFKSPFRLFGSSPVSQVVDLAVR